MRKLEKIYQVKNLKTGEVYTTSTVYEKEIDGIKFAGVWRETDPQPRINWMRKDQLEKVRTQ
jgi:hypothetical protein